MRSVGVGIIGLGTVGSGVVRMIRTHHDDYVENQGIDLQIVKACARNPQRGFDLGLADVFTTDWHEVIADPKVDVVVEVIGGTTVALDLVSAALQGGKHVVTANKALLASHGSELYELADKMNLRLSGEASVAGGIPIVEPLRQCLNGNKIVTIAGIMNGTTNYILTRMEKEGLSFEEILSDAQKLGYAEADPSADVDGIDAANKIAILGTIGFNSKLDLNDVTVEGIRKVAPMDIEFARDLGYKVKLVAIARNTPTGIDIRVHPTMLPEDHMLSSVDGVFNAVYVIGDCVGEVMFFGQGAGSLPTASAVMGDVLQIGAYLKDDNIPLQRRTATKVNLPLRDISNLHTKYYIRLKAEDKTGILAATTAVFANNEVSISNMVQPTVSEGGEAVLVYVTHRATEQNVMAALNEIQKIDDIIEVSSVIRVEDTETWKKGIIA